MRFENTRNIINAFLFSVLGLINIKGTGLTISQETYEGLQDLCKFRVWCQLKMSTTPSIFRGNPFADKGQSCYCHRNPASPNFSTIFTQVSYILIRVQEHRRIGSNILRFSKIIRKLRTSGCRVDWHDWEYMFIDVGFGTSVVKCIAHFLCHVCKYKL